MSWEDPTVARQQFDLAQGELAQWRDGKEWPHFESIANSLRFAQPRSVLEVGCASGYMSEVIKSVSAATAYTGCDVSRAALDLGRERYANHSFDYADARHLPYLADEFNLVLHGSCILTLPVEDWPEVIAEAARVSSKWVVFYKTPVRPNLFATCEIEKDAYGTTVPETHVAEAAWATMLQEAGLVVSQTHKWNIGVDPEQWTQLCRKAE